MNDKIEIEEEVEELIEKEIIEEVDQNEDIQVQVEFKKKTKSTGNKIIISILKLVLGLYVIGALVGINEIILMKADPIFEAIHTSSFMTATFVPWANAVLGPVRFMIGLLSWFTPIVILNALLFFILSKIKWISKKELKIFLCITIALLLLIFSLIKISF